MSVLPLPALSHQLSQSDAISQRLLSLDVLRGLTIAGMILVTDPGRYGVSFAPLQHAAWDGATLTDLIFPCFLIMTGVSLTLSLAARLGRGETRSHFLLHALRRCGFLIVLGLLVNGFPFYDLAHLRLPGILQRIGICYLLAACVYVPLQRAGIGRGRRSLLLGAVVFSCLAGYWALLVLYPTPGFGPGHLDSLRNLPAVVDRAVFTVPHLWAYGLTPGYGVTYDPESLLSTVPVLATVLIGVLAGEVLGSGGCRARQCGVLAGGGTVLWLAGVGGSHLLVLNKRIYTPTFALFSDGLSLLLLSGLCYAIDLRDWTLLPSWVSPRGRTVERGWTLPLVFGTNAIFAFALSSVITTLFSVVHVREAGRPAGLHTFIYDHLFAGAWLAPSVSSLAYAMAMVVLNAALIYPLYRRGVFLKL